MTDHALRQALAYARRGWPAFPCLPGQKIPATPHGYKDATTDEQQITEWFGHGQRWNLAIATGCCPALKMPMLAAFTMPTENRAIRAVSWVRCRSTWVRCRTDGRFLAMIAVCGQAEAGNGADGSAGRGHGQQPAAGEHVDPRPPAGVLQPVAAAEDQRRGRQVLQRAAQLVSAGPGQQAVLAGCQDGADAGDAQPGGGPAGAADPAAHGQ